jgi:WD40-like Beta Propeller Repeat
VIGADGSGLTEVIPDGRNPYWSPDGSRIAFEAGRRVLGITDSDGMNVETFGAARAGPWNPLTLSPAGKGNPTGSGLAAPWVYAIALVVLVGVVIGGLRARGNIAAKREDQSNDVAS